MTFSDTALRAALRLYPAAYRREREDELTAVFADATTGAGRSATAREAFDLGAYGLRLRTGLTSTGVPGRALAMAAPFAAGAAAGYAALVVTASAVLGVPDPGTGGETWLLLLLMSVLPVFSLLAALAGSWKPARVLALPAVTVAPVAVVLGYWAVTGDMPDLSVLARMTAFSVPAALWSLAVLLAPVDLLGRVTAGRRLVMLGALLFGAAQSALPELSRLGTAGGIAPLQLLAAGLVVLAYAGVRRGRALPLALLVVVLPPAVGVFAAQAGNGPGASRIMLPFALVVTAGVVTALRLIRPQHPDGPDGALPVAE